VNATNKPKDNGSIYCSPLSKGASRPVIINKKSAINWFKNKPNPIGKAAYGNFNGTAVTVSEVQFLHKQQTNNQIHK
tara:strand:+ start:514 stop:744 length:231 start_codon:yes stop_codon:yes gene_type:complete